MNRIVQLFIITTLIFPLQCFSQHVMQEDKTDTTIIYLQDYGLEKTRKKDCTKIIKEALKEVNNLSPTVILFPRGEYHFYAEQSTQHNFQFHNSIDEKGFNCAIIFEEKSDVIIDGNGSTLIFHGIVQPFTFFNCRNITLKNINIDWEQPFLAQGEVVKVNNEFIELAIDLKESPYRVESGKLYFDAEGNNPKIWKRATEVDRSDKYIIPQTGELACLGEGWENYTAENIIPGVVRLYYPFRRKPAIGNYLILQYTDQYHAGLFIQESKNITIRNVNIYHSAGIGIVAENNESLLFDECKIIPNNAKNRFFSTCDAGLFISDCKDEIIINNCEFSGMMDNTITIQESDKQEINSNYSIINNQFGSSSGSGILISSADNITIWDNYFASSGSGIIISGNTENILINNNQFSDLCNTGWYENSEAIISIISENSGSSETTELAHKSIAISENSFNPFDFPILFAQLVDSIAFGNNNVKRSMRFEPFHASPYSFTFDRCNTILINDNVFAEEVLGKNVQLKNTPISDSNITIQSGLNIDQ